MVAVLAAVVVGAQRWIAGQSAARQAAPAAPRQRPAPLVRTATIDRTLLVEQSEFPGELRASATADIFSRVAGRLGAVLIKEGSFVAAGGLVARIDDPELELAIKQAEAAVEVQRARLAQIRAGARSQEVAQVEASLAQAEASLAQAERELARTQQLFADGLVARAAVDRAQTDVELARQRVRAVREQLALVKQGPRQEDIDAQVAQVRQAEVNVAQIRARLRELRITSPIAGVATRVNVERGAVISTQTALATVATIRPIELHVGLPETDLARLRKTSVVKFRPEAMPDQLFEGKITRIAPALDVASRSARLVVTVPNGNGSLRPGMFARVVVVFDERQAILIPTDAIIRRGDAAVVFVANMKEAKDGAAPVEERAVKTGYVEGNRSEILEGLDAGETIVTTGQQGLRDGMQVRVGSGASRPGQDGAPGSGSRPSPGAGQNQPATEPSPRTRP
jgi:multidrug efflux pump subunit AcrA (membrane-fusion protein)